MKTIREFVVRPKPGENIRTAFECFLLRATEEGWPKLKVLFGCAWGNHVHGKEWIEKDMSAAELSVSVMELEAQGVGLIGDDDLYVTIESTGTQFTFCHENDIHIQGSPEDLFVQAELGRFRNMGWAIHERTKAPNQSVPADTVIKEMEANSPRPRTNV